MNFKVRGHKVLIKPDPVFDPRDLPPELRAKAFKIVYPTDQEKREKAGTQKGTVVAVGAMAWKNAALGYGEEGWEPWAYIGEKVFFARYAGKILVDDTTGEDYVVINDEDIQVVIEEKGTA